MSDGDGCFTALLVAACVAFLAWGVFDTGREGARREFRECRQLLVTADSATVLKTKPECERWTLPVREEKTR